MTPVSSVEAVQPTVIELAVALSTARLPGVVGACVSGGGAVGAQAFVVVLIFAFDERLPAASNASTPRV